MIALSAIHETFRAADVKPTTSAVAARIAFRAQPKQHEGEPVRVGVEIFTILALIQALIPIIQACRDVPPEPEEAVKWLHGHDVRFRPIKRIVRARLINAHIAREWERVRGAGVRLPEVRDAVNAELDQLTPDVLAELYADNKPVE